MGKTNSIEEKTNSFSPDTHFSGFLKFKETLRIEGTFKGTIEAEGALIVAKGAVVEADRICVRSLSVYGTVIAAVLAEDMVDMFPGAQVKGDITAARLRIADEVLFEGQCSMTGEEKEVEIFSRPTEEIKAELQRTNDRSGDAD
ncbi:MAG: polymer-forming cytoskeletal protein [Spirochaetaceae bacterium]|jgi:cytoskeletal protein CcmA (bactofilin family)|nr:polymer-forming cytoskeletal protein [Spirochaetaceae bacterium]